MRKMCPFSISSRSAAASPNRPRRGGKGRAGLGSRSVRQERTSGAGAVGQGMVDVRFGRQGQLCWRGEIGSAAELHRPRHLPGNGARRQEDEYQQIIDCDGQGGVRDAESSTPRGLLARAVYPASGLPTKPARQLFFSAANSLMILSARRKPSAATGMPA